MSSKLNGKGVNIDAHFTYLIFPTYLAGSRRKLGTSDQQIAQTLVYLCPTINQPSVQSNIDGCQASHLGNPALSSRVQKGQRDTTVGRSTKAVRGVFGTEGAPVCSLNAITGVWI